MKTDVAFFVVPSHDVICGTKLHLDCRELAT